MSLINQMLQELDARGAGAQAALPKKSGMPQQMRVVEESSLPRKSAPWPQLLMLLLALLLAGGVFWWLARTPAASPAANPELPDYVSKPLLHGMRLDPILKNVPPAGGAESAENAENADSAANQASPPAVPLADKPAQGTAVNTAAKNAERGVSESLSVGAKMPVAEDATRLKPAVLLADSGKAQTGAQNTAHVPAHPLPPGAIKLQNDSPAQKAEGEYRKAVQAAQNGRQAEALAALEQALHFDAGHVAARQMLINSLLAGQRVDEALQRLQQAVTQEPGQTQFVMLLARLQAERGQVQQAVETMYSHLTHGMQQSDYRAQLAALLQRERRHKEAIEHFQAALQMQAGNAVWWMGCGISLQAENRNKEAQEAYLRAKNLGSLSVPLQVFVDQRLQQLAQGTGLGGTH